MSQPPQGPYGAGPPPSPYGGPTPPAPGQPPGVQPPAPGMSNKAKFWIGVLLALPALLISGTVLAAGVSLADAIDDSGTLTGIAQAVLSGALLVGYILLLVWRKSRWFALGLLAGSAVLFILAAGACVVLLVAITSSYN